MHQQERSPHYWFTPKTYGRGFVPISWEGWVATFVLLGLILLDAWTLNFFNEPGPSFQEVGRFIFDMVIVIFAVSRYFEKKCDGPLEWRWGEK